MKQDLDKILGNIKVNNDIVRTNNAALSDLLSVRNKKKKRIVIQTREAVLLGASAISFAAALAGCAANAKVEEPVVENTEQATTEDMTDVSEDVSEEEFKFELPADSLDTQLGQVDITNDMKTPEEVVEELNEQYGETYTGPTYTPEEGGSTWVSEEEYQEAVDAGIADAPVGTETVTITGDVFVAPDGSAWESEAEYNAYMAGQTGETVISVESGFTAPDGTIWENEEEYNRFVQSNNGTVVTPGNGEIIEEGEGFHAPDGTYWESEEEYYSYMDGLEEDFYDEYDDDYDDYDYDSHDTDEYGGYYKDGYYWVDGDAYQSRQDYLDLQGEYQDSYDDSYDNSTEVSDYYQAPDGTYWSSEEDYRASLNDEVSVNSATVQSEEEQVSETDDFYQAPDGTYWSNEDEYNWYINSQVSEASYEEDLAVASIATEDAPVIEDNATTFEESIDEDIDDTFEESEEEEITTTEEEELQDLGDNIEEFFTAPDGTVWQVKRNITFTWILYKLVKI